LIGKSQWCCSANCGHPVTRGNAQLDPRHAASMHTTAPINHTKPSSRKHSPDGATRATKQTSDYSLLLIYRPRKDDGLSWPSWLACSGQFTHISGHPSSAGRAQDRESSPANVLPLCHATNQHDSPGGSTRRGQCRLHFRRSRLLRGRTHLLNDHFNGHAE